jgi:transcriptional regulator with XRE-family HTH domain
VAELAVDRVKARMKHAILQAGYSQKEVERRLGWGEGYISQILRGKVAFKLKHCFAVLAVIGVAPGDFFRELFREPPGQEGAPPGLALSSPALARPQLRDEVETIVRELLVERTGRAGSGD